MSTIVEFGIKRLLLLLSIEAAYKEYEDKNGVRFAHDGKTRVPLRGGEEADLGVIAQEAINSIDSDKLQSIQDFIHKGDTVMDIAHLTGIKKEYIEALAAYQAKADKLIDHLQENREKDALVARAILESMDVANFVSDAEKKAFLAGYTKTPSVVQASRTSSLFLAARRKMAADRHNEALQSLKDDPDWGIAGDIVANSVDAAVLATLVAMPYAMPAKALASGVDIMTLLARMVAVKGVVKGSQKAALTFQKEKIQRTESVSMAFFLGVAVAGVMSRMGSEDGTAIVNDITLLLKASGIKEDETLDKIPDLYAKIQEMRAIAKSEGMSAATTSMLSTLSDELLAKGV